MSNIIFVFYLYIGIYDWYLEIIIMEIKSKIKKIQLTVSERIL